MVISLSNICTVCKHTHKDTQSSIRQETGACLRSDVAAVTLSLSESCTSGSIILRNIHSHVTYTLTWMQSQVMKIWIPTDCTQATLSLSLAAKEQLSLPYFSLPHTQKCKGPVSRNLMIKELWGEGGVFMSETKERFRMPLPSPYSNPECTPISLSHTYWVLFFVLCPQTVCLLWTCTQRQISALLLEHVDGAHSYGMQSMAVWSSNHCAGFYYYKSIVSL